jgi:hypothetical protein
MDVQVTAALAAMLPHLRREKEAEKQRRAGEVRAAMQRLDSTRDGRHRKKVLEVYSDYASSEDRLSWVLSLFDEFAAPGIFWSAFMEAWSNCGATWHARTRLLQALHAMGLAVPFFSPAQRTFFDALPAHVQVFRGCP